MHNGSQIQGNGWTNASTSSDNSRKLRYCCVFCQKELNARFDYHFTVCEKFLNQGIDGIDFISCKICGVKKLKLTQHIKSHNVSKEQYLEKYGSLVCEKSKKSYGANKILRKKTNFRNKLKNEGRIEELEKYNLKVGEKVSEAILSDDSLRKQRSENLTSLNKTEQFRRKASETAIKTSARPEIQEQRAERLKKWREENPEEFHSKCVSVVSKYRVSKPQKLLFEFVRSNEGFKHNQQLRHKKFLINKSGIRQIDIMNLKDKIIIEFDGEIHFKNIQKWNQLEKIRQKDAELNSLIDDEWCIIRVGHDQFSYRKQDYGFRQECLNKISNIIREKKPGLYLIGKVYEQN